MWLTIHKFFRFIGRVVLSTLLLIILLVTALVILLVQLAAHAPL